MSIPFDPPIELSEIQSILTDLEDIELIKTGGEGTVLKAYDKAIDTTIAMKIYSPDHLITRTELEVKKLSLMNSPYILKLFKHGKFVLRGHECFFIVTNYIEGDDLRKILDSKIKLDYHEVTKVLKCIASAIDSLWSAKVVHCDIKPENIIKNGDEYILIDLGIAKHLDASTMTAAGMIMGTMGYLAPEQFNGRKNITLKSDYFALGIVCYELLTGYHPFNRNQIAVMSNPLPRLPLTLQVPDKLKDLIYKLTDLVPYRRPLNFNEIDQVLKEVR